MTPSNPEQSASRSGLSAAPVAQDLSAYKVPRPTAPIEIHLDGNEGLMPSRSLMKSLAEISPETIRNYPSRVNLEEIIAKKLDVSPAQVLVTGGADDALDRTARAMLAPGREMIIPVPTFEMIERYARLTGGTVVKVPWNSQKYPLEEVKAAIGDDTASIAVVSPNNPTGAVITREELRDLVIAAKGALVVLDLAYVEFADQDLTQVALEFPNVVIVRTLSKAWGLAGLRVGYAVGSEEVIGWMRAVGNPYAVSGPSLALAAHRLQSSENDVAAFIERIRTERQSLENLLSALGAKVSPSQANFVFARFQNSLWTWQALASLGISVRRFPNDPTLLDALRITCPGDPMFMNKLTDALRSILRPQAILFDLDGVLADVSQSYRKAIIQTAEYFGVTVSGLDIAEIKAAGGANNDWEVTQRLVQARGKNPGFDEIKRVFEEMYQGTDDKPGFRETEKLLVTVEFLKQLSEKVSLGIVTGRPRKDADAFLDRFGIRDLFQAVVCMEDAPLKPDPGPVLVALRLLKTKYAWLVGDTPDDVVAARGAGVVPIGILSPSDQQGDPDRARSALFASGAARVLLNVSDLEEIL